MGPDGLTSPEDYDALKLTDSVVKPGTNLIKKGPADLVGTASTMCTGLTDPSTMVSDTMTGITDGDFRTEYVDKEDDDAEVGEHIKAVPLALVPRLKLLVETGLYNPQNQVDCCKLLSQGLSGRIGCTN